MRTAQRVLVIDDDVAVGEIVCASARAMGMSCDVTREPLTVVNLVTPDTGLILLDLMMPGMDGVELLRLLGERQCKAGIVLMSGINIRVIETAKKLARTLGLSVVGHLQKPFALPELKAVLGATAAEEMPDAYIADPEIAIPDQELRNAFEHNEFVLYYQPQMSIATGEVTGVEALTRWQHPKAGLIFPDHFISHIEALGLMDRFCWITVDRAMADVKQFADPDGKVPRLALNVSVSSLRDLKFPDTFMSLAREHDFPAENIAIEITESGLIEFSLALDVLTRLRMRNIQLSIDDFGTGYSMMRQLQNVPAIELKIDKMFVQNMYSNHSDLVMVEKIIEMGHEMEMEVIAEGVETEDQFRLLREKGCDGVQGFLFSRALPPDELVGWLDSYRSRQVLQGQ